MKTDYVSRRWLLESGIIAHDGTEITALCDILPEMLKEKVWIINVKEVSNLL